MKPNTSWTEEQKAVLKVMDLIGKPEKWCQGYTALGRGVCGWMPCNANDVEAERWCLMGAFARVGGEEGAVYGAAANAWDATQQLVPGASAVAFNDTHTHAEVMQLLTKLLVKLAKPG